ncbi:hypothetical protein WA158_006046 [Blastocystis sp. Blastoise]
MKEYFLSQQLAGHAGAVKCLQSIQADREVIISGGDTGEVFFWTFAEANEYIPFQDPLSFPKGINCMLPFSDSTFFAGFKDNVARLLTFDGTTLQTYSGHSSGVISLGLTNQNQLITGSWDGTAKVWSIESGECIYTLPNQENGISVIGLPDGTVVTASTGMKSDDLNPQLIGYKLRVWNTNHCTRIITQHNSSIRCLVPVGNTSIPVGNSQEGLFISGSNDGSVKIWNKKCQCIMTAQAAPDDEMKYPFVLSCRCVYNRGNSKYFIVTGTDDNRLCIWENDILVQTIMHPSTVWSVLITNNNDIITACNDGIIRVFSCDKNRRADAVTLSDFEEAVKKGTRKGGNALDPKTLPPYEKREQYPGKREGEVFIFRKGDIPYAYNWSMSSHSWIEVGEVTGGLEGEVGKDGRIYDKIMDISVEQGTGEVVYQLGYNFTDNPYVIATQFVEEHGLDETYIEEIVQGMSRENPSKVGGNNQIIGDSRVTPQESNKNMISTFNSNIFPSTTYIRYTKLNQKGVFNKILSLNNRGLFVHSPLPFGDSRGDTDISQYLLYDEEIHQLELLTQSLSEGQSFSFLPIHQIIMNKLIHWPQEVIFPCLDILKSLALNDDAIDVFFTKNENNRGNDNKINFFTILQQWDSSRLDSRGILVIFRFLSNFIRESTADYIYPYLLLLLNWSKVYMNTSEVNLLQAASSFLLNTTICLSKLKHVDHTHVMETVVSLSCQLLTVTNDNSTLQRIFLTLGNCLLDTYTVFRCIDEDTKNYINIYTKAIAIDPQVSSKAKELDRLCVFTISKLYV